MRRKDGEEARKGLCLTCLLGRASEAAMAQRIEDSHLSAQEKALLTHLRALDPARSATIAPPLSASERLADRLATAIGSWRFLILETLLFAAWIMLAGWIANWDPYPFILLNLVLAIQAAYAGPIIMMSQTRQAAIDSAPLHERLRDQRQGGTGDQAAAPEDRQDSRTGDPRASSDPRSH